GYGGIDPALPATAVTIEPTTGLASETPVLDQFRKRRRGGKTLPERRVQHPRRLLRDVQPNLVEQRYRSDREAPRDHQAVQLVDRRPFEQQVARLVHVGRENAVHPKPRSVAHDHGGLPHPATERTR